MKFIPELWFYTSPVQQGARAHAESRKENSDPKSKDVPEDDELTKLAQAEERLGMSTIALMVMVRSG